MMHAAGRVALKKFGHRRVLPQGMQKLNLRIAQGHKDSRHPVLGQVHGRGDLGSERIAVSLSCGLKVGHNDGHMIERSDHFELRLFQVGDSQDPNHGDWLLARILAQNPAYGNTHRLLDNQVVQKIPAAEAG